MGAALAALFYLFTFTKENKKVDEAISTILEFVLSDPRSHWPC